MKCRSPRVTTKSINLACYLSMHHGLLVKVEVKKTGKRSDEMRLTFTNPFIRKLKKLYKPETCYVTAKNLLKLTERISGLLDDEKRANYQEGLVIGGAA
jgi:hypothetical protein